MLEQNLGARFSGLKELRNRDRLSSSIRLMVEILLIQKQLNMKMASFNAMDRQRHGSKAGADMESTH